MHLPLTCKSCGIVLSAPGGRCPSCGALQPGLDEITQVDLSVPNRVSPSMHPGSEGHPGAAGRPRPRSTPAPAPQKAPWPLWVLLILLSTVVTLAIIRSIHLSKEEERARQQAAEAAARNNVEPVEISEPTTIRLVAAWSEALSRAQNWNREAVLVRMEASGLDAKGILSFAQGNAVFEYGARGLGEQPALLPRVGTERFVVTFESGGTKVETTKGPVDVSSVPEPDCLPEEAVRIGPAPDFAPDALRTIRYAFNTQLDKAVWSLTDPTDSKKTRVLDGKSCNVIVR